MIRYRDNRGRLPPRRAPQSLRPARMDVVQADAFAQLIAALPQSPANDRGDA